MDRRDTLDKYCKSADERLLASKLLDKDALARKTYAVQYTQFLTPAERQFAQRFCDKTGLNAVFDGGYEDAERTVALFCPPDLPDAESPVRAVRFTPDAGTYKSPALPTHRDYLGALLSLGITRAVVGDIVVGEDGAVAAVLSEIEEFILQNMDRAGKTPLTASGAELSALATPGTEGKTVKGTVASLRLDCVVGEAFSLAREKAKALCASGAVLVNHLPETAPDRQVGEGDVISARGKGRATVESAGAPTKKGRIPVLIRVFK